ncbi:MAG TPA: hypothetical protein VNW92_21095, partial [Polyangiaceae bacterium]|nr:hypothetical protein [Polyangiaceae bacterium]
MADRSSTRPSLVALVALVCGSFGAAACQSDVNAKIALARLDTTCRINSDCDTLLVCAFQRCHEACVTSRDCQDGARCVAGDQPKHVCQLPAEQACSAPHACPGTEVCGVDARCRDSCASDRDCLAEQICTGGTCADRSELGDAGALAPDLDAALPAPCAYNSDCPGQLVCLAGVCRAECQADTDCPTATVCRSSRCVTDTDAMAGC